MLQPLKRTIALVSLALSTMLAGCSTIAHKPMAAAASDVNGHRTLAIFFDGTANDEQSDTNVKRLHSLVTLQKRRDIATLYIEGVGTGEDVLGMGLGLGMRPRVEIAYEFVLNHYLPGDRIFLFGFSRGSYAARILTSLLYHAGVVKGDGLSNKAIADIVYSTVKGKMPDGSEPSRLDAVHKRLMYLNLKPSDPVPVELLGLWDTVEALGYRDSFSKLIHKLGIKKHEVNVDNANARYGDKLCNVRQVRHAMSIDDDREWIFTPRLMTRAFLFDGCAPKFPSMLKTSDGRVDTSRLKQVWFAGAHSDVGGGYPDSQLSGVSLNWMLDELRNPAFDLIPPDAAVPQDPFGTSHDPESSWFSPLYHAVNRDIVSYALQNATVPGYRGSICVHPAVFERRRVMIPKHHENDQLILRQPGTVCLVDDDRPDLSYRSRYKERQDTSPCCKESHEASQSCKAFIDVRQFPDCQQETTP